MQHTSSPTLDMHLNSLRVYWRDHRTIPTIAALTTVLGMRSTGGVHKTLNKLVTQGLLGRVGNRYAPTDAFFATTPADARAPRPAPTPALRGIEAIEVAAFPVERPDQTVYCRVDGDALREAGILDGDIAVVDRSLSPRADDMVAAVTDGGATVEWLRFVEKPAACGQSMPSRRACEAGAARRQTEILGVVVGSFRRFRR